MSAVGALKARRSFVGELYRDAAGEWRWRIVSTANGKTVADSAEGYVRQTDCRRLFRLLHPVMRLRISTKRPLRG